MPTSPVATVLLGAGLVCAVASAPLVLVYVLAFAAVLFEVGLFIAAGRTSDDGLGA